MKIFSKLGELIIKLFSIIGAIILEIPNIPNRLRKIDTERIKNNVSRIGKDVDQSISKISKTQTSKSNDVTEVSSKKEVKIESPKASKMLKDAIEDRFSSQEKEGTILRLQIIAAAFLIISILYIFNFFSFIIYSVIGVLLIAYMLYLLFTKVKLMYSRDFNAYRDFFLMYIAIGIILVLVGGNTYLMMAFPFQFFPSFSVLIFAVILVIGVFLIFRIKYYRNYTFGQVIESGRKTAHVRVDYDIRTNVKPDIYLVENDLKVNDGSWVKLQIEGKILSTSGNKPIKIIEIVEQSK
ncbi:MAG: DUF2101 domain-containing protein [Euryarchaeota archaeon]|nr:DUF2101 domain-containing protein [Euryarchaeota archaeon]